jgi:hypothetical protein
VRFNRILRFHSLWPSQSSIGSDCFLGAREKKILKNLIAPKKAGKNKRLPFTERMVQAMEQSIALQNLFKRYFESLPNGSVTSFVENNFSQLEGVLAIATSQNSWWEGYNTIVSAAKSEEEPLMSCKIIDLDISASCEGTVGWAVSRCVLKMPNEPELPIRATAVFHLENGSWKFIQLHQSVGLSGE